MSLCSPDCVHSSHTSRPAVRPPNTQILPLPPLAMLTSAGRIPLRVVPCSITAAMIAAAIEQEETALHEPDAGIDYALYTPTPPERAASLRLSFHGIKSISNLDGLQALQQLRLDNNAIATISGLDALPNLRWLDLSFNQISTISGLESLVHLTDLSLYQNKITEVEGVQHCTRLQYLSLGANPIPHLKSTLYLRQLRSLKALSLQGCPLCSEADYRAYVMLYLPQLEYLDNQLILPEELAAAREAVSLDEIRELEDIDASLRAQASAAEAAAKETERYVVARLQPGRRMADLLAPGHAHWDLVRHYPDMVRWAAEYAESLKELVDALCKAGLSAAEGIDSEVAQFEAALAVVLAQSDAAINKQLLALRSKIKHEVDQVDLGQLIADAGTSEASFADVCAAREERLQASRVAGQDTAAACLATEAETHVTIEAMLEALEAELINLRAAKLAVHTKFFRGLEQLETESHEKALAWAKEVPDKAQAARDSCEPDDFSAAAIALIGPTGHWDMLELLANQEKLVDALKEASSHRVAMMNKAEAECTAAEQKHVEQLLRAARLREMSRTRQRVSDAQAYLQQLLKVLDTAAADLQAERKQRAKRRRSRKSMLPRVE